MWGLGFRVQGSGFRVWGLGFGVYGCRALYSGRGFGSLEFFGETAGADEHLVGLDGVRRMQLRLPSPQKALNSETCLLLFGEQKKPFGATDPAQQRP